MRLTSLSLLLVIMTLGGYSSSLFAQTGYIQSKLAPVFDKPSFAGKKIASLNRGQQVEIVAREKSWVNIRFEQQSGWVAKMLLDNHAPLASTQVEPGKTENTPTKARKRASVRASAAATRGFSSEFRQRSKEPRSANYRDLEKLEQLKIEDTEVREFNQSLSN